MSFPSVSIKAGTIAINGIPINELVDTAAGKQVLEAKKFVPVVSASDAGRFYRRAEYGAPSGVQQIGATDFPGYATMTEGRFKEYLFTKIGMAIAFAKDDLDDVAASKHKAAKFFTLDRGIKSLVRGRAEFIEQLCAAAWENMNAATEAAFPWASMILPDTQPVLSTTHTMPGVPSTQTQSNLAAAYQSPTATTIREAMRALRHFTDSQGSMFPMVPLTLVCSDLLRDDNKLYELMWYDGDTTNTAQQRISAVRQGIAEEFSGERMAIWLHLGSSLSWTVADLSDQPLEFCSKRPLATKQSFDEKHEVYVAWFKEMFGIIPKPDGWARIYRHQHA